MKLLLVMILALPVLAGTLTSDVACSINPSGIPQSVTSQAHCGLTSGDVFSSATAETFGTFGVHVSAAGSSGSQMQYGATSTANAEQVTTIQANSQEQNGFVLLSLVGANIWNGGFASDSLRFSFGGYTYQCGGNLPCTGFPTHLLPIALGGPIVIDVYASVSEISPIGMSSNASATGDIQFSLFAGDGVTPVGWSEVNESRFNLDTARTPEPASFTMMLGAILVGGLWVLARKRQ